MQMKQRSRHVAGYNETHATQVAAHESKYTRCFFFFKQKTAYEMRTSLEFRRVLFRSRQRLVGLRRAYLDREGNLLHVAAGQDRWEERRGGKGCSSRWWPTH